MRIISRTWLAALSLAVTGAAWAGVSVSYVQAEKFSDLPRQATERERMLKALSEHFQKLGQKLPPDQTLKIEVTDIDLAGREEPSRRTMDDLRVLRGGADWPHMSLRYSLESNGKVLRSGSDNLSDMSYLNRINSYSSGDTLRYEKRMIDDWFAQQFGKAKSS